MYTCLLEGLARSNPMIAESFGADGDPALNLNIVVSLPPRNPYMPGDQPAYADSSGPDCRGLTNIDAMIAAAQNGEYYCPDAPRDGVNSPDSPYYGNPNCLAAVAPRTSPRAPVTRTPAPGSRCRSTCPARQQNWTSCAASSATRPAPTPRRSPTCPPRPWLLCFAERR